MDQYLRGIITTEELEELRQFEEIYPRISIWLENKEVKREEIRQLLHAHMAEDIQTKWEATVAKVQRKRQKRKAKGWLIAASVIAILCLGVWGASHWSGSVQSPIVAKTSKSVQPGKEQAILTLSNGQTVLLGEKGNTIIREGGNEMKIVDNQLDYAATSRQEVYRHKLRVPIGGIYRIQLNDGTTVWLNADSEMEYPSVFTGTERIVSVKGEAYFEVAKDASRPFIVNVGQSTVEAVGTAFNINTHLKEGQIKTILTEGRIRVSVADKSVLIDEGNATMVDSKGISVAKADPEEAQAWKDGYFYFGGKDLRNIMNEVSRWYGVDVEYERTLSDEKYQGGIKRTESIQAVCNVLKGVTGLDIQIKNRTLVVK